MTSGAKAYLDTEFTGLSPDAALISIGLVPEAGTPVYYAELTDTYTLGACGDFCVAHVLPLLEGEPVQRRADQVREELIAWFAGRAAQADGTVVVISDSPRDLDQLRRLFQDDLPPGVSLRVATFWENTRRRWANRGRRLHRRHGLRLHHALDDARVNHMIWAAQGR